jgi:hypothetical protein
MNEPMSAQVLAFPGDVFSRWRRRFPDLNATDPDPRDERPCVGVDCQTFAWRGYDGLCGWCHEAADRG